MTAKRLVDELLDRVKQLEGRIKELEARPVYIPYPVGYPYPQPVYIQQPMYIPQPYTPTWTITCTSPNYQSGNMMSYSGGANG